MATRPFFEAENNSIKELTDGLTDEVSYIAQNVGSFSAEYCTTPTEPTQDTNIGWHIVNQNDFIIFTPTSTDRVWVRANGLNTLLAISENN